MKKHKRFFQHKGKIVDVMSIFSTRICFCLFLLLFAYSTSASSFGVNQVQEGKKSNSRMTLHSLFSQIEKNSNYVILYKKNIIDDNEILTDVDLNNIEGTLKKVLPEHNLDYHISGRQIVITEMDSKNQSSKTNFTQQQTKVSGVVKDKEGELLTGVSIQIKGSATGTISDIDGKFSINVPAANTVLVFSFVGYVKQEITVGNKSTLDVVLYEDVQLMDEVVIVGYGKSNRKDVTGAVSTMKAEDMNTGIVNSPAQMLQGKVPGLNITKSGNPNDAGSIVLRGSSTLRDGANAPFYVIDGVPGASIDLVSPDDIVSIDVLKDASSNAIYGSRAANGVIMITTRRAKAGENTYASYSGYVGIETVSKRLKMMSGDQLRDYTQGTINPVDDIDGANTNWQKEVQRTAFSTNHGVSFGGSGKSTTYGASINYADNQGVIRGTDFNRLIFRGNVEQKLLDDRLTLGMNLSSSKRTQNDIHSYVLLNMLQFLPTVPVMQDGQYVENFTHTGFYGNPVGMINENKKKNIQQVTLANISANVLIIDDLNLHLNYSKQTTDTKNNIYYGSKTSIEQYRGMGGVAIRNNYVDTDDIFEGYADYAKVFGQHDFKAMLGYSWQEYRTDDGFQNANAGFTSDALLYNNLNLGNSPDIVSTNDRWGTGTVNTLRMISFYGRLNYQFNNRYLAQLTVRRDGSSAFGENHRWGTFPAGSVGWKIRNEKFMESLTDLTELRLRASYGISGNSAGFDPMISRLKYGKQGSTLVGGKIISAIGPTQNANPDLKWETTGMFNIGLDFGLFNNRLTGVFEYYNKTTKDLIWDYAVPTTEYHVGTLLANVGKIRNTGFELQLTANVIDTKQFSWNSTIVLSTNKNKVISLTNDKFTDTFRRTGSVSAPGQSFLTTQIVQEGKSIGTWYLPAWAGRDANNLSVYYDVDGNIVTDATTNNYREFAKGTAQPKVLYGWQNSFTYRDFDLSFFLRGVAGNYLLNATRAQFNRIGEANQFNILVEAGDAPREDARNHFVSDRYLESGSYFRLDNATIGYTMKSKIPFVKSLRLYCTGNNLFVITKYKGIDPEINLSGMSPGVDDRNYYPKTRSFLFGMNLNF